MKIAGRLPLTGGNQGQARKTVMRFGALARWMSLLLIAAGVFGVWPGLTARNGLWAAERREQPELCEKELARRELNAKFDIRNLRQRTEFVVERSDAFLDLPEGRPIDGEFSVASVAPTVKLQILPDMQPEYYSGEGYQAGWANWAKVTRSDDHRFYMAVGDHRGRGAQINLYEYRPEDDVVKRVLDISAALDWHDDMYTDGKIHGRMGFMPDGTLWAATHRGPQPTEAWWEAGYRGSWLFSFNVNTGEARDWGVPLIGNELPCHALDPQRGIFMATGGLTPTILSWDIHAERARFAGYPPNGWVWHPRTMFLDPETGHFWGMDSSEQPYRFLSFDPELNRFKRHDVEVPSNPVTGRQRPLRGHTTRPAIDGWYYWATGNGAFFRFRPDWENGPEIETVGVTWHRGMDALQLALSPDGRYIYYMGKGYPSALVQYDVVSGQRKAIAFMQDYFFEKYGYWTGGAIYGMEISNDGSFVVVLDNGTFEGRNRNYGHPSVMMIEIPEEERQ